MMDIVERLLSVDVLKGLSADAASEILDLRAERDRLRAALPVVPDGCELVCVEKGEIDKLRAERDALLALIPLVEDVLGQHADPDNWRYQDCDKPDEICEWCIQAKAAMDAAIKEGK